MSRLFKVFIVFLPFWIIGCDNLPSDLQAKKESINAKYYSLVEKEKTASSNSDYEQLIEGYNEFKNEAISYTAECNKRGISRNNDKTIQEAEEKISYYTSLINANQTTVVESNSIEDKYTCDVCGKEFTGNGYCEGDDGNWRPCIDEDNTLPYICSYQCALTKKRRIEDAWNKVDEKINEIKSKSLPAGAHNCSMCRGTGIEKNTSHLTDEYGRVCPMCEGKGYVIDGY
jgi:hypothetical protein